MIAGEVLSEEVTTCSWSLPFDIMYPFPFGMGVFVLRCSCGDSAGVSYASLETEYLASRSRLSDPVALVMARLSLPPYML
jgi:hypothetical protein